MKNVLALIAATMTCVPVGNLPVSNIDAGCHQANIRVQKFQHQNVFVPVVSKQLVSYVVAAQPVNYWSVGESVRHDVELKRSEAEAERITNLVMKKLEQRLNASTGAQQPQAPQVPLGLTVLQNNCSKCHNPTSKAVVEGRSPKLFDGNGNLTVSQQEIGSILTVIRKGIMPPKPADLLSDDDFLAVKQYLESGTPPVAAPAAAQQSTQPAQPQPPAPQQPAPSY